MEKEKDVGVEELTIASMGVIYGLNDIKQVNVGGERVNFIRHHKVNQENYKEFAEKIVEDFNVETKLGKFGVLIKNMGKEYFYSMTEDGRVYVAGDQTVFSRYLQKLKVEYSKVLRDAYLKESSLQGLMKTIESGFVILPSDQEKKLEDIVMTLSLRKPKDWIEEIVDFTKGLGVKEPEIGMVKDEVIVRKLNNKGKYVHVTKVSWKNDYESVQGFIAGMTKIWAECKELYVKPNNNVVRGGGHTIVNLTKGQKEYREYVDLKVKEALSMTKNVISAHKVKHSNTTFSSYITFTSLEGADFKISVRDHSDIHELGYVRFYIDAKNREDFSKRLARIIDTLVKLK